MTMVAIYRRNSSKMKVKRSVISFESWKMYLLRKILLERKYIDTKRSRVPY
jgi:hypothetical protein